MTHAPVKPKKKTGAPKGNKNAKGNKGGGRPSSYKAEYAEWAEKLAKLGATDVDLAHAFGITEQTINAWKKDHLDFLLALKRGKEEADANIAERLYQRAMGYSHPDTHFSAYEGIVTATPMIKHYPPDTTAAIFWLKNRRPELWRDKTDLTVTVKKTAEELSDEELAHIATNGRDGANSTPNGAQKPGVIH